MQEKSRVVHTCLSRLLVFQPLCKGLTSACSLPVILQRKKALRVFWHSCGIERDSQCLDNTAALLQADEMPFGPSAFSLPVCCLWGEVSHVMDDT